MYRFYRITTSAICIMAGLTSCAQPNPGQAADQSAGRSGLSPGPKGALTGQDHRVPLTWIEQPGQFGPGDYARLLEHDGKKRYYEMHVPEKYEAGRPLPLVLVLHGGSGYAAVMRYISQMDELSEREGFLVVYPAGTNPLFFDKFLFWNTGQPYKNPQRAKVDDIGYIEAVLEDAAQSFAVDQKRVYATGMSNGALMCYRLAVELSDRIAAIGPVAGQRAVEEFEKRPTRAVPVIHFHGKQDAWLHYEGGKGRERRTIYKNIVHPPVEKAVASWADLYNCAVEPEVERNPKRQVIRYPACDGGAEVVLWAFEHGGHTWPGGKVTRFERRAGVGHLVSEVSASQVMWDFFKRFSLP